MRKELRKKKKRNSEFQVMFVGEDDGGYTPPIKEPVIQVPPQPKSDKVISTVEKIKTEEKPPKREKK